MKKSQLIPVKNIFWIDHRLSNNGSTSTQGKSFEYSKHVPSVFSYAPDNH